MKRIITEPLRITSKDGRVVGFYLPSGKVKIIANSFCRTQETNTLLPVYRNIRSLLINQGYVKNGVFIKEYTFSNACEAYCCCYGRQDNGIAKFFTTDNIELDSYLEIDAIEAYEQSQRLTRSNLENDDSEDVVSTLRQEDVDDLTLSYIPEPKPDTTKSESEKVKRDPAKSKKCIIVSNYKCAIDESHESFTTRAGIPYMEAHHLIPLCLQDKFNFSLDVDANIVCLCPNCHKKLHYGKDINDELKLLYESRKDYLKSSGIEVTFGELLKFYE